MTSWRTVDCTQDCNQGRRCECAGIHVVPINDLRDHVLNLRCWCRPQRDLEAPHVIVHYSMDGREAFERGERLPS